MATREQISSMTFISWVITTTVMRCRISMLEALISLLESWGVNSAASQLAFLTDPGTMLFAVWETVYAPMVPSMLRVSAPRMFTFTPQSMAREAIRGW